MEEKLVVTISILKGNFQEGFEVSVLIAKEEKYPHNTFIGKLPPYQKDPCISYLYNDWLSKYKDIKSSLRMHSGVGNIEDIRQEHISKCQQSAANFLDAFKTWLTSGDSDFQEFKQKLIQAFGEQLKQPEIRVLIQTKDSLLKKLPWHKWDLFAEIYTKAEVALCNPEFKTTSKQFTHKKIARILAIFGGSDNINYESDIESLKKLKGADITFLQNPRRNDISNNLWEQQNWDILFFAGHSENKDGKGQFWINDTEYLTIEQLRYGLRRAIEHDLQLAIFNSCDGLKIADDLADLNIPQVIVMREPVNDLVAQQFLKFFLFAFSRGDSLYLAVRYARERLHDDGYDDTIPGSTWLPVIYQNPATIPLEWKWEKEFIASPEVDYENGKVYYNNKEFAQALDCFLKAAEQGHTDAQNYLGIIYSEKYNNYHEAIKWFTRAAEKGNVKAQINLGDGYFNGTLGEKNQKKAAYWYSQVAEQSHQVILEIFRIDEIYDRGKEYYNTKNFDQAFYWFRIAASQGNADGQNGLGTMYSQGKGVKLNHQKAMEYFHKAAEQGHAKAKANLGVMFERTENYQDAFKWFYEAALQGYAFGQVKLGNMYRYGKGTAQDNGKAVYWYREAAKQGDADAQCNLGMMYQYGKGVDRSLIQSVEWYHKAANQGHADAQNYLGFMYHNGKGVEKSEKHAVYWYHKATDQEHAYAQYNLGTVYEYGKEEQNAIEANKWYCKAFEQANEEGLFRLLGIMYENGKGTKQDRNKARDYYFKATEQGDISAQYSLGRLFLKDGDTEVAFNYFSIAAKQGFDQAQYDLGKMCYDGKGTNKAESEAFVWFEKAAEQGHIQAQNQLGIMYWNGIGVHKNDQESFKWFKKAAKQGDIQAQKNLKAMQG
jgi:TPR repeat protein